jgi:hypothetical protein
MVHNRHRITIGLLCGVALLLLCASGVLAADPSVTITVSKWMQAPLAPTNFTITELSATSINITWTMGVAANSTIIRADTSGYPWTVLDGNAIYSGNATYVVVEGLSLTDTCYYFRAWSENEYGTSATYAQDSIGDCEPAVSADLSALMALITGLIEGPTGIVNMMFAVALMGFAFWKKGWLRVMMAASLIIWGTFMTAYDMKIAAPFIAVGTILFLMAIFKLIGDYREDRERAVWVN